MFTAEPIGVTKELLAAIIKAIRNGNGSYPDCMAAEYMMGAMMAATVVMDRNSVMTAAAMQTAIITIRGLLPQMLRIPWEILAAMPVF
jgi:hypothetical protein